MLLSKLLGVLKEDIIIFVHIYETGELLHWGTVDIVKEVVIKHKQDGLVNKIEIGNNNITLYLDKLKA
jgi:hypothetical protein